MRERELEAREQELQRAKADVMVMKQDAELARKAAASAAKDLDVATQRRRGPGAIPQQQIPTC